MTRVHTLPKGVHIRPMPPMKKAVIKGTGRRLPGGLPPKGIRCSAANWGVANSNARSGKREPVHIMDRTILSGYSAFINAGRRDR